MRRTGIAAVAVIALGAALAVVSATGPAVARQEAPEGVIAAEVLEAIDDGPVEVLVLQTESQLQGFTLAETWYAEGGDARVHFWPVQSGLRPLRWTRASATAFELETLGEPFLDGVFDSTSGHIGQTYRCAVPEVGAGGLTPSGWR